MVLAHDVGPSAGMGHLRRCGAIAAAVRALGATTTLVPLVDEVLPQDLDTLGADIVLVDSYRLRADERTRPVGLLAAIDDLDRDLDVDVLVEPAPRDDNGRRRASVVLRGFEHAPLDPSIAGRQPRSPGRDVEVVLVTAGRSTLGSRFAARVAVDIATDLRGATVLVAGVDATDPSDSTLPVRCLPPLPSLVETMADVDLVVSAAGVTALESVALGRPTVVFPIADNQRATFEGLVAAGAAMEASATSAAAVAIALAGDAPRRRELAARGPTVVDGLGAERVAAALLDG